jgi:hypothetical protein
MQHSIISMLHGHHTVLSSIPQMYFQQHDTVLSSIPQVYFQQHVTVPSSIPHVYFQQHDTVLSSIPQVYFQQHVTVPSSIPHVYFQQHVTVPSSIPHVYFQQHVTVPSSIPLMIERSATVHLPYDPTPFDIDQGCTQLDVVNKIFTTDSPSKQYTWLTPEGLRDHIQCTSQAQVLL